MSAFLRSILYSFCLWLLCLEALGQKGPVIRPAPAEPGDTSHYLYDLVKALAE